MWEQDIFELKDFEGRDVSTSLGKIGEEKENHFKGNVQLCFLECIVDTSGHRLSWLGKEKERFCYIVSNANGQ